MVFVIQTSPCYTMTGALQLIHSYPVMKAIGKVVALGEIAKEKGLTIGQRVGIGWNNSACLHCERCH